jgi:hypothetical protein
VIQEYKRIRLTKMDKKGVYSTSQELRLTKMADEALDQIEKKRYRNAVWDHVTELHEYGVAFIRKNEKCIVASCSHGSCKPGLGLPQSH